MPFLGFSDNLLQHAYIIYPPPPKKKCDTFDECDPFDIAYKTCLILVWGGLPSFNAFSTSFFFLNAEAVYEFNASSVVKQWHCQKMNKTYTLI